MKLLRGLLEVFALLMTVQMMRKKKAYHSLVAWPQGNQFLAEQHIEGTYRVDANMFKPQADFLLKVYGQSMKDIGI